MIKFENVSKSFGEHKLFENINHEIKDGEFVIFSGASGCGKTTMLNIIGGLEKTSTGRVLVDGVDISKRKNQLEFFRNKFALVENKTVRQNLELVKNNNRSDITIEQALEKVGLPKKIDEKIYTLSGGEQQRVALARLMIKKCDLILADEPTGSLDKANAMAVMDIIESMNKEQNKTIIMVTHDEELKTRGSRIIDL